jgi:LDH2 family malate/lactate/ureidoglycolate dehydrogenase
MLTFRADALQTLVTRACEAMGARGEDAEQVATSLVRSNLCGYDSHGVFRIAQYHAWWKLGLLKPAARPRVAAEAPFAAKVDGQFAFGQVVANFATQVAVAKARTSGIAALTVAANNHVGRLADYVETIQQAGLVGFVAANDSGSGQCVVPWGGLDPRFSTNPLAMGIPGGPDGGILFDFSTSAAAMGKVRQFMMRGERVPAGWLIDAAGKETRDPASLVATPPGSLLPAGGPRGFALGLMVDVLAGILSGSGYPTPHPGPDEMNGMFILALDPSWFLPLDRFRAQVDELTRYVKTSRPMPGVGPVHIPGEKSRAEEARRREEGITLNEENWKQVAGVLRELGVADPTPA